MFCIVYIHYTFTRAYNVALFVYSPPFYGPFTSSSCLWDASAQTFFHPHTFVVTKLHAKCRGFDGARPARFYLTFRIKLNNKGGLFQLINKSHNYNLVHFPSIFHERIVPIFILRLFFPHFVLHCAPPPPSVTGEMYCFPRRQLIFSFDRRVIYIIWKVFESTNRFCLSVPQFSNE